MNISDIVRQAEDIARREQERQENLKETLRYLSALSAAHFFETMALAPTGEYDPITAASLANDAYKEAGVPDRAHVPRG